MPRLADGLTEHDGVIRCWWCGDHADYQAYHDEEWGRPVDDDHRLFEKMSLEGFQSGLSWLTILRKRDNFREAFADFDFEVIARWRASKVDTLLKNAGIVRHRGKIEAVLSNAKEMRALVDEHGSFAAYVWSFEPGARDRPKRFTKKELVALAQTEGSKALAKDLKKRGFRFFGPTTAYAFMQAMGLVNDHIEGCAHRREVEADRAAFVRPHLIRETSMHSDAQTVEDYLDSLTEDRREDLEMVRRVILANLPDGYVETMSWGMICYQVPLSVEPDTYNGQPLMYAALASQKKHMAVYMTGVYMEDERRDAFERAFAERGKKLDAGKSCVRFKRVEDLALDVIGECIAAYSVGDFVEGFKSIQSGRKVKKQTATKTASAKKKTGPTRKKKNSGRTTK